jgi:hypothetical protein
MNRHRFALALPRSENPGHFLSPVRLAPERPCALMSEESSERRENRER